MQQAVEYQLLHLLPWLGHLLELRAPVNNKNNIHMFAVDKIHMLAESKLNSIEKIISRALSDMDISHEELIIN